MNKLQVCRTHEVCIGHCVTGHTEEVVDGKTIKSTGRGKCYNLHGHNYTFEFGVQHMQAVLDDIGRVVDFSVIKFLLCEWLEQNWDHKFLVYQEDERAAKLASMDSGVVIVPFNPTAENIGNYFVDVVGPQLLVPLNLELVKLTIWETGKCSVVIEKIDE